MRNLAIALILLSSIACVNADDPTPLGFGAPVRVVAPSFAPGWHQGSIGTVGDCVVVMIPEPPRDPIRLHTIDFADVAELEVQYTTTQRWTRLSDDALRRQPGNCLP